MNTEVENQKKSLTRFEQICQAFREGNNTYINHRDDCWYLGGAICGRLQEYLALPKGECFFMPVTGEEADPKLTYSLPGSLRLEEDGYFHFGFGFDVYEVRGGYPSERFILHFKIGKRNGKFLVVINGTENEFLIADPKDNAKIEEICIFIFDKLIHIYRNGFSEFLAGRFTKREIGFAAVAQKQGLLPTSNP